MCITYDPAENQHNVCVGGGHIFEELGCVIMDTAFCNLETNEVSFSSKAAWFQTKRTTFSLHPRTKEANVLHKVLAGMLSLL